MKRRHFLLFLFLFLFAGYACFEFTQSLRPYVSFAEAKTAKTTVQVKGTLVKTPGSIRYEKEQLYFTLLDETGAQVPVIYQGLKPDNMEHAESIVVIGKYDGDHFTAEKLLVKCPSKYERKGASS